MTWGNLHYGGDSTSVQTCLRNVQQVKGTGGEQRSSNLPKGFIKVSLRVPEAKGPKLLGGPSQDL